MLPQNKFLFYDAILPSISSCVDEVLLNIVAPYSLGPYSPGFYRSTVVIIACVAYHIM